MDIVNNGDHNQPVAFSRVTLHAGEEIEIFSKIPRSPDVNKQIRKVHDIRQELLVIPQVKNPTLKQDVIAIDHKLEILEGGLKAGEIPLVKLPESKYTGGKPQNIIAQSPQRTSPLPLVRPSLQSIKLNGKGWKPTAIGTPLVVNSVTKDNTPLKVNNPSPRPGPNNQSLVSHHGVNAITSIPKEIELSNAPTKPQLGDTQVGLKSTSINPIALRFTKVFIEPTLINYQVRDKASEGLDQLSRAELNEKNGKTTQAQKQYEQAALLFSEAAQEGDKNETSNNYYYAGVASEKAGQKQHAQKYFKLASEGYHQQAQELENKSDDAHTMRIHALETSKLGGDKKLTVKYAQSLYQDIEAQTASQEFKNKDYFHAALNYAALGKGAKDEGLEKEAQEYYSKALGSMYHFIKSAKQSNDLESELGGYGAAAGLAETMGDQSLAEGYYEKFEKSVKEKYAQAKTTEEKDRLVACVTMLAQNPKVSRTGQKHYTRLAQVLEKKSSSPQ